MVVGLHDTGPRRLRVKASASRAADLGLIPFFAVGLFPGGVIAVTYKLIPQWLASRALSAIESALRLVGPVYLAVQCDWMRY